MRPLNPILVDKLKAWRVEESRKQGVPAYWIITSHNIAAIASLEPTTIEDLAKIRGMGVARIDRYGEDILRLVRQSRPNVEVIPTVVDDVWLSPVNDDLVCYQDSKGDYKKLAESVSLETYAVTDWDGTCAECRKILVVEHYNPTSVGTTNVEVKLGTIVVTLYDFPSSLRCLSGDGSSIEARKQVVAAVVEYFSQLDLGLWLHDTIEWERLT